MMSAPMSSARSSSWSVVWMSSCVPNTSSTASVKKAPMVVRYSGFCDSVQQHDGRLQGRARNERLQLGTGQVLPGAIGARTYRSFASCWRRSRSGSETVARPWRTAAVIPKLSPQIGQLRMPASEAYMVQCLMIWRMVASCGGASLVDGRQMAVAGVQNGELRCAADGVASLERDEGDRATGSGRAAAS